MGNSVSTHSATVAPDPLVHIEQSKKVSSMEENTLCESHATCTTTITPMPSVHGNLMRSQHRLDPMQYYTVCAVLGEGSMGYVAKVRKKDSVRGGSARPEFVKKRHGCCFQLLSFLNLPVGFSENNALFVDYSTSSTTPTVSSLSSSSSTTTTNNSGPKPLPAKSNPKVLFPQRSSSMLITYGTKKESYYALKSILLDRCSTAEFKEELKNEIEILKNLDHPNIVRAIETFDYHDRVFIVLELCSGGDLYTRDPYSEEAARKIITCLFEAVAYLASKGIVHRDLKFENIMFVDESPQAEVKIIDFGLSQKFAADEHLHDAVGTVYTMAPELIGGDYDSKADVWSLGVIAFMLLSSSMPFYGKDRGNVLKQILRGKYSFTARRWRTVSTEAKEFVKSLLRRHPEKRPSAEDALHAPWLAEDFNTNSTLVDIEQMDTIQASMQAFAGYRTLKKLALMVVAYKSTSEEIGFLRKMFSKFDTLNDGEITLEEFREALLENYHYSDEEIETMFHGIDIDGSGKVHYIEFLAATIEAHGSIDEERLAEAFDRIDGDDSGVIRVKNLKDFLGDDLPDAYLEKVIEEAHGIHEHEITYEDFLGLWDTDADEQLKTAKINVGSRHRMDRLSSFVSTVSSVGSDELNESDHFSGDTMASIGVPKTGSYYYRDRKEMSVRNAGIQYGDV